MNSGQLSAASKPCPLGHWSLVRSMAAGGSASSAAKNSRRPESLANKRENHWMCGVACRIPARAMARKAPLSESSICTRAPRGKRLSRADCIAKEARGAASFSKRGNESGLSQPRPDAVTIRHTNTRHVGRAASVQAPQQANPTANG